jgi:hypothetical protein
MADIAEEMGLVTLADAEREYGVKRSTLYRYVRQGDLKTYRRAMDRRTYIRRADLVRLRCFREAEPGSGPTIAAVERALAFQRRVFGERELRVPSADLIEEARRERAAELS